MISVPGYSLQREIGRGGMATVYLAVQDSLSRPVAIKILAPHLALDAAFVQRFVREGQIAAGLRHRHIVPIVDVGVFEQGAFIALAWMPNGSLADRPLPLPAVEAVRMLREMATALGHAHRAGVVHRDVKPDNILVDEDGAFVLGDFGIAQLGHSPRLTAEHTAIGTPAYMAPERWRGEELDGRADLYSLGIVFYQCLTGQVPFRGADGWSIGLQHMQAALPMLPSALAQWQPLLDGLLAKLPQQRFATAQALLAEVQNLSGGVDLPVPRWSDGAAARQTGLFQTGERQSARSLRVRIALAGVGLLMLAFAGWLIGLRQLPLKGLPGGDPKLATLLVLPCESFANLIAHRELGDNLAVALILRLSQLPDLNVIAHSARALAPDASPEQLAIRSAATHVLSCSIRRAPDGVRIGAELLETAHGTVRWSADFERGSDDLLSIVDELAVGISERLLDQLAGPERARLMRNRATSLDALARVDRARALLEQGDAAALGAAKHAAEQAIALDPRYAGARVTLAQVLRAIAQLPGEDRSSWRAATQALIDQAVQLDPDTPSAYTLRGGIACADFDWEGCRLDLQRAVSLAPASAEVQALAAHFYLLQGPAPRAVEWAKRWLRSAPDQELAWQTLVQALIRADRAHLALDVVESASQRFPGSAAVWLWRAQSLLSLRRCDEAMVAVQQARQRFVGPKAESTAAEVWACAGQFEALRELRRTQERALAIGEPYDALVLAISQLALEQKAAALDTLESMLQARDARLPEWISRPQSGSERLRGDVRWQRLLDRLQLPAAMEASP